MITAETYVMTEQGIPVTYKIETADGEGYVVIGVISGLRSAVALTSNEPDMFRRAADAIIEVRDEFLRNVLEHRKHPSLRRRDAHRRAMTTTHPSHRSGRTAATPFDWCG